MCFFCGVSFLHCVTQTFAFVVCLLIEKSNFMRLLYRIQYSVVNYFTGVVKKQTNKQIQHQQMIRNDTEFFVTSWIICIFPFCSNLFFHSSPDYFISVFYPGEICSPVHLSPQSISLHLSVSSLYLFLLLLRCFCSIPNTLLPYFFTFACLLTSRIYSYSCCRFEYQVRS